MSTVVWNHDKVVLPINEPADGPQEEPDRGVPRLLRRARRAAHRPAHRRHRRRRCAPCGPGACASWTCPPSTTTRPASGWPASTCRGTALAELGDPRRPRPRGLPAPDLHRDAHRPADGLLRDHPARGRHRLRRGQLQGALRVHRASPGPTGQPLADGRRPAVGARGRRAGRPTSACRPARSRRSTAAPASSGPRQPPLPAARRRPTGSSVEGPAAHHAYDTRRLDRARRALAHARCSATTRCRSRGTATTRAAPSSSATPTATSCSSSTPATGPPAHRVRPARLPRRRLPRRARAAPPTASSRPTPDRPARRRGARSRASRCPTGGCSAATRCSTRRCIEVPEAEAVDEEGEFTVVVKRLGQDTRVTYPFHPCDVVGWKGDVAPMRHQRRRLPPGHLGPLPPAAVGPHDLRGRRLRRVHVRARGRWRRTPRRCGCRSSTATSTTTR